VDSQAKLNLQNRFAGICFFKLFYIFWCCLPVLSQDDFVKLVERMNLLAD